MVKKQISNTVKRKILNSKFRLTSEYSLVMKTFLILHIVLNLKEKFKKETIIPNIPRLRKQFSNSK